MRVIAGTFGGRRLEVPGRGVRPTTDRVRESVFAALFSRIDWEGCQVLDLFAGSGALGFEALSRGADRVTFVETAGSARSVIHRNADTLDVAGRVEILATDAHRYVNSTDTRFDVVFADPPYGEAGLEALAEGAMRLLNEEGWFILEYAANRRPAFTASPDHVRRYGDTEVAFFSRGAHPSPDDHA